MRLFFEEGERELFARRLGLSADANDALVAEAAAQHFNDADNRRVGTPDDDYWDDIADRMHGEPRHRALAASARARRQAGAMPQGEPAPRTRGRVTFQGSGQSFLDR
jgi:hypothetical protein